MVFGTFDPAFSWMVDYEPAGVVVVVVTLFNASQVSMVCMLPGVTASTGTF